MPRTALDIIASNKERDIVAVRRLIANVANTEYETVMFSPESIKLDDEKIAQLTEYLQRYDNDEPISKIIHKKGFWKHDFFVNEHVLDPRPETELLVTSSLHLLPQKQKAQILDIGTGSGCILLSLLYELQNATGVGIDMSSEAIAVANINKQRLGISSAEFVCVSWNDFKPETQFDIIVSNPPYIRSHDIEALDNNVKKFDPLLALDGGADGLSAYREIAHLARTWLNPQDGILVFEVGYDQAYDVGTLLDQYGYSDITILKDLSGIDRVVIGHI